jgi:hypothetical protein
MKHKWILGLELLWFWSPLTLGFRMEKGFIVLNDGITRDSV